jgi:hypothetical protein
LFVNSATHKGQISQIIYEAVRNEGTIRVNSLQEVEKEIKSIIEEMCAENKIIISEKLISPDNLPTIINSEVFRRIYLSITRFYNLDLKIVHIIEQSNISDMIKKVAATSDSLPTGTYLLQGLSQNSSEPSHAMTYIKESNKKAYLFNPGIGTFFIENQAQLIRALLILNYKSLQIIRCKEKKVMPDEATVFRKRVLKGL